jgi:hypothetical protein
MGSLSQAAKGGVKAQIPSNLADHEFKDKVTTALNNEMTTGKEGWKDLLTNITVRGTGLSAPVFSQIGATDFYAYLFPGTGVQIKEFRINFHIPHDYMPGTAVYIHVHWFPSTADTGNVAWNISYTIAKGFNQAAFNFASPTTVEVIQAAPGVQYQHMIAEMSDAQAIPGSLIETDSIIACRIWRDPADADDTYAADAFANFVDLHYRTDGLETTDKAVGTGWVKQLHKQNR